MLGPNWCFHHRVSQPAAATTAAATAAASAAATAATAATPASVQDRRSTQQHHHQATPAASSPSNTKQQQQQHHQATPAAKNNSCTNRMLNAISLQITEPHPLTSITLIAVVVDRQAQRLPREQLHRHFGSRSCEILCLRVLRCTDPCHCQVREAWLINGPCVNAVGVGGAVVRTRSAQPYQDAVRII